MQHPRAHAALLDERVHEQQRDQRDAEVFRERGRGHERARERHPGVTSSGQTGRPGIDGPDEERQHQHVAHHGHGRDEEHRREQPRQDGQRRVHAPTPSQQEHARDDGQCGKHQGQVEGTLAPTNHRGDQRQIVQTRAADSSSRRTSPCRSRTSSPESRRDRRDVSESAWPPRGTTGRRCGRRDSQRAPGARRPGRGRATAAGDRRAVAMAAGASPRVRSAEESFGVASIASVGSIRSRSIIRHEGRGVNPSTESAGRTSATNYGRTNGTVTPAAGALTRLGVVGRCAPATAAAHDTHASLAIIRSCG